MVIPTLANVALLPFILSLANINSRLSEPLNPFTNPVSVFAIKTGGRI
jgi:hypothetical protein